MVLAFTQEPTMRIPRSLEDDPCPGGDEMLARLYRAHKLGLAELVDTVSPLMRARLALYCYSRSHLHDLGIAIAASCDREVLVEIGDKRGEVLFIRARELAGRSERRLPGRPKITLATAAPSPPRPAIDDEAQDADELVIEDDVELHP
jgi:hypothetical protein